jgi:hypothetical protein
MFRPTAIVARKQEVKDIAMDPLGSPTVPDGFIATKNARAQQSDGRYFPLGKPGLIRGGKTI